MTDDLLTELLARSAIVHVARAIGCAMFGRGKRLFAGLEGRSVAPEICPRKAGRG
jgi:hypothetical protein